MGFATAADTNYEGNSLPVLGIGTYDNASLVGAKFETGLAKTDGTPLEDRISIFFKTAEGQPFTYSEVRPKDAEKEGKMTIRIGHVLSKFYEKVQLVQNNQTFETYATWAVQMLNAAVPKNQKVKFIIIGSVYEGKARTGLPKYPPFIVKAGEDLGFDKNALESNAEYYAHTAAPTPDTPAGGQPTGGAPNQKTVGEF